LYNSIYVMIILSLNTYKINKSMSDRFNDDSIWTSTNVKLQSGTEHFFYKILCFKFDRGVRITPHII